MPLRIACVLLLILEPVALTGQAPGTVLSRRIEFWNPEWSLDGSRLLFESTLPGKYGIYTIAADGSDLRLLTPDGHSSEQGSYSPDGRRIVFSSDRAGHLDLYLMNADGSHQVRLTTTSGGGVYQSAFSPDGRWIVFQGRPDNRETRDRIYLIASDGSGFRTLTDSSYGAEGPRWSPDGRSVTFTQVPYPRRYWSEMESADFEAARAGERTMRVALDGSAPTPIATPPEQGDTAWNHDHSKGAYTKSVDGWAGLYLYDTGSRTERLLLGGPGAGPIGYLRTATLRASVDSFETFTSARGSVERTGGGQRFVRTVRQVGAARWEVSDQWYDSTGTLTATQTVRTGDGTLATERETVRALTDSASLLIAPSRITGWVVPEGGAVRLLDGPYTGERYSGAFVLAAIAQAIPTAGAVFEAPAAGLFGAAPLVPLVDSLVVLARDTILRGATTVPVLVLRRGNTLHWIDAATGVQLAARGNAGPQRWWWHLQRGVQLNARAAQ